MLELDPVPEVAESEIPPANVETVTLSTELKVHPADPEADMLLDEAFDQSFPTDHVVMRVDGVSSFLTLSEHFKRGGKELADCDLSNLTFDGVSFRKANLKGAKLDGSTFRNCDFTDADLNGCSARNCDFENSQFHGSDLTNVVFTGSNLQGTAFFQLLDVLASTEDHDARRFRRSTDYSIKTHDSSASRATSIKSADFHECDLRGARFVAPATIDSEELTPSVTLGIARTRKVFIRKRFADSEIARCKFVNADLSGIDLRNLILAGSDFSSANLHGAKLTGADVQGVDLSACNLVNADLHGIKYSSSTQLPNGYPLPTDAVNMDAEREKKRQRELAEKRTARRMIFFMLAIVGSVVALLMAAIVADTRQDESEFHSQSEPSDSVTRIVAKYSTPSEVNLSEATEDDLVFVPPKISVSERTRRDQKWGSIEEGLSPFRNSGGNWQSVLNRSRQLRSARRRDRSVSRVLSALHKEYEIYQDAVLWLPTFDGSRNRVLEDLLNICRLEATTYAACAEEYVGSSHGITVMGQLTRDSESVWDNLRISLSHMFPAALRDPINEARKESTFAALRDINKLNVAERDAVAQIWDDYPQLA